MINVKNKTNYNDDDDPNVVNFNKNSEEVEETILDDTDKTTSDNNEDTKDEKDDNNVTPKMYVLTAVYEAHFFKTNMNVFKDLLKTIPLLTIKNTKSNWKINQFINHRNNIKHKTLVYVGEECIKFSQ